MKALTLALALLLVGCAHQPVIPIPADKETVNIDRRLLAPISPMQEPEIRTHTEKEELGMYATWSSQYATCTRVATDLQDLVRKAFNIKY